MKKLWIFVLSFLIFITLTFLLPEPFPKEISYTGTAIEYSPVDETVAIPHQVQIEGTYYRKLIGRDYFLGTFYVSDVEHMVLSEGGTRLFISRENGSPAFPTDYGNGWGMTGIFEIYSTRYFKEMALMFTEELEVREDGSSASARYDTAHFLVLDAQNREDALAKYEKLQRKFYVVG